MGWRTSEANPFERLAYWGGHGDLCRRGHFIYGRRETWDGTDVSGVLCG